VPAPTARGAVGRVRALANRAFAETVVVDGNGHGAEVAAGEGHTAIGPGDGGQQPGHGDGPDGGGGDGGPAAPGAG
jgi:hypothetical protein